MTDQGLTRLLRQWQSRLRLRDWDITVKFAAREDISADGMTCMSPGLRTASIQICQPEQAKRPLGGQEWNTEQVLVHELLHLCFPHVQPPEGSVENAEFESGIDRVAWALVRTRG